MATQNAELDDVELTSERFEDLDLDPRTKKVLKDKGYSCLTKVQSQVLPLALAGNNLIIQSPTGSGKTLCFLLPAVKLLFDDGYSGSVPSDVSLLGCICLASTRELATQSAIQMNDLAQPLGLKAGCCIGGIRDKYDKTNARRLQILTGTPGRVLALMSNQAITDTANVKLLVLDEADRLLDSGFRNDILDIVSYLPPDTQILLFSATIKAALQDLCDSLLSGKEYKFVCLGSDAALLSEAKLRQEYIVVPMSLKLPALFHLLSKNQRKRFIVFLATCKHVRFVFEVFKRLIPAVPMTEWHGKQSQLKRNEQFTRFAAKQNYGCIFTTDVGARGVDFPAVDYVIQIDIPDSVTTYTHRVGRTGRLTVDGTRSFGNAFTIVGENETAFVDDLKISGVKIHNLTKLMWPLLVRKEKYVLQKLQALLAKEAWIKEIAQRAVIAYMRYLSTRKSVTLSGKALVEAVQQMALAAGLPAAPHIEAAEEDEGEGSAPAKKVNKLAKLKEKIKQKKLKGQPTEDDQPAGRGGSNAKAKKPEAASDDGHSSSDETDDEGHGGTAPQRTRFRAKVSQSTAAQRRHTGKQRQGHKKTEDAATTDDEEGERDNRKGNSMDTSGCGKSSDGEESEPEPDVATGASANGNDVILKRGGLECVEDDLRSYMERKAAENKEEVRLKSNLTATRKKLRLNRHGVAKLRGIETIKQTEQKHVVFDADSDDEADERYTEEMPTLDKLTQEKGAYVKRLAAQLKQNAQHDHEWEARRRAERRAKRLNKPLPF